MNLPRLLLAFAALAFFDLRAGVASGVDDVEIIRDGRGRTIAVRNKAALPPQATYYASLARIATEPFTVEAAMEKGTAMLAQAIGDSTVPATPK